MRKAENVETGEAYIKTFRTTRRHTGEIENPSRSVRAAFFPLSDSMQFFKSEEKKKNEFLTNGGNYYRGCWDTV